MNKLEKTKKYFKDLVFSLFDTNYLFKFHHYNWLTPVIILVIIIAIIVSPIIIVYSTLSVDDVTSEALYVDKAMADILTHEFDCSISNNKLTCAKEYDYYDYSYTDEKGLVTSYRIYMNTNMENVKLNIENYDVVLPSDNYIYFGKEAFSYRYTQRDPITKTVTPRQLTSFYDNLNGFNFKEAHQTYLSKTDSDEANNYLMQQANHLIVNGYKAVAYETIFITIITQVFPYLLFILVAALLIKGNYLLKKKKGFTYSQSLKISIVSSLQSLIIALGLRLMGMDFMTSLGLAITCRILYIYFKYTGSRRNTQWIDNIYQEYKNERFNI